MTNVANPTITNAGPSPPKMKISSWVLSLIVYMTNADAKRDKGGCKADSEYKDWIKMAQQFNNA